MNQLVREDNAELIATYVYEYDTAGNILCQKIYPYTVEDLGTPIDIKTYSYATTGWKDKLVAVDDRTITYDEIGNPITYLGYNLTWDNVRQLKTFGYHSFDYQADGKRFRKNEIWYAYQGDKLLREIHPDNTVLTFLYDTSGILGFSYRNNYTRDENGNPHFDEKRYFYKKNLQGDVIAVYDDLGAKCAEYKYDAWGNCTVTKDIDGVAELNPIRYRSYYYDIETDLYYLNSRYYNPEIGRFINADSIEYLGANNDLIAHNLYQYCSNNPINMIDPSGHVALVDDLLGAAVALMLLLLLEPAVETMDVAVKGAYDYFTDREKEKDKAQETDIVKADPHSKASYYGAHIYSNVFSKTTLPMNFKETVIWVTAVSESGVYGKGSKWGVYTENSADAFLLAFTLGGGIPVHDMAATGKYGHFHVFGRNFGKYKHFHIWYGNLG